MAAQGFSQRWKLHLPEFKHSKRGLSSTTEDSERGKTERGASRGLHKSVTMAATSRYLTDKHYVMRKPLFSAEQHTSILKKRHPQNPTEQKKQLGVNRGEYTAMKFLTRPRKALIPESFNLYDSDISPPSASGKDLGSPLGVSELQAWLSCEEPTFQSSFSDSRISEQSFSSSILQVQRIKPPLRPQLTSTVLNPTYTPRSEYSRPGQTQLRLKEVEESDKWETKLCSLKAHSKGSPESPYQTNYWACAIPKALPPSPDRHSAGWDPNMDYQTLLDYTYPVRLGHVVSEWDSFELQAESLLQTDPNLQDSGIELNQLCSSTSLSGMDFSLSRARYTRRSSNHNAGHRSPDLQDFTRSYDVPPSSSPASHMDAMTTSLDSLDRSATNCSKSDGPYHQRNVLSSSHSIPTAFHSTSVLSQSGCLCREVDEEFWCLPEQLEELQLLSKQVREVTSLLNQPVTSSWKSLDPGTTSILSSIDLSEKHEAENKEEEAEVKEDKDKGKRRGSEQTRAAQTADHSGSETMRSSFGGRVEPAGGELSRSSLKEVEALVERLSGLTLPDRQRMNQEDQEQSKSLMQHIQVFCSHLELLIQWLYAVSEKMELLAAATVSPDSVKSTLAEYESFQKEVSSHQPLTSGVLHTGQLLLSCINTTSPLLRDSLMLIERQSGALQTHTEHFFSSILSTMDSLTQQSREDGPVEVQGSSL
ncbi:centrosomal protein of 68 kDa isoform X1 [Amphiprion ocellaris]|uniref:centrosomal protein of 68 kDa isoform X1 n=2 Tax=Amphiprion ocellaris TaxID=80972 RepID=UPI0024115BFE|nr:centrosomal protein of 68 kDa isoform X1 [Amphiprion ocellaris]XP_023119556.2 centrosomal protein of 68 kDa isoform X1 [Amphiprion ocellaris]XP_035801093.2 centrosomal protein of 68 kDa isoform X1 [Amphiprion ocellaris]